MIQIQDPTNVADETPTPAVGEEPAVRQGQRLSPESVFGESPGICISAPERIQAEYGVQISNL